MFKHISISDPVHQSDNNASDDDDAMNETKANKKNAQLDLSSRSRSQIDFRSTAKDRAPLLATNKKKAMSPRSGKHFEILRLHATISMNHFVSVRFFYEKQ